jgi:hypothetical protein
MKKAAILFVSVLIAGNSLAQLNKGAIMLGGYGTYWQRDDNNKLDSITRNISNNRYGNFSINAGYVLNKNTVAGINIAYQNNRYRYSNEFGPDTNKTVYGGVQRGNMYSAGLFLRQYKLITKNRFGFFYQLVARYGHGFTRSSQTNYINGVSSLTGSVLDENYYEIGAAFNPGIFYFITDRMCLEMAYGSLEYFSDRNYFYTNGRQTGSGKTANFGANFNLSTFRFGLNFFLGGKRAAPEVTK